MNVNKTLIAFIKIAFSIMVVLFIIYAAVSLCTLGYDFGYRVFTEPAMEAEPGHDRQVRITEDMSGSDIGRTLEENGLVRDARLFSLQLKLSAYAKKIKPGVYILNTSMTAKEMMIVMAAEDTTESTEETNNAAEIEGTTEVEMDETGE